MARRAGLNPSGIYQILRGEKTNPKQATLEKIAAGLGPPLSVMLAEMSGDPPRDEDPQLARILALYRTSSQQGRDLA